MWIMERLRNRRRPQNQKAAPQAAVYPDWNLSMEELNYRPVGQPSGMYFGYVSRNARFFVSSLLTFDYCATR